MNDASRHEAAHGLLAHDLGLHVASLHVAGAYGETAVLLKRPTRVYMLPAPERRRYIIDVAAICYVGALADGTAHPSASDYARVQQYEGYAPLPPSWASLVTQGKAQAATWLKGNQQRVEQVSRHLRIYGSLDRERWLRITKRMDATAERQRAAAFQKSLRDPANFENIYMDAPCYSPPAFPCFPFPPGLGGFPFHSPHKKGLFYA